MMADEIERAENVFLIIIIFVWVSKFGLGKKTQEKRREDTV